MGITPLGVFIFYSHSKTKTKNSIHQLLVLGLCSWMVYFCKKTRTFILIWILFFHFPIKLVLPTYGPFSWSKSHMYQNLIVANALVSVKACVCMHWNISENFWVPLYKIVSRYKNRLEWNALTHFTISLIELKIPIPKYTLSKKTNFG